MKSPSPVLSHIKIQPLICLELFCLESGDFSQDSEEITFPLETTLWIMDSYFSQKQWFEVKTTDLFLTNTQLLSSQDVNWWTGVVWIIVMFLSAVWTHSDGTHSLQRIHWWASDTFLQICSDEETNSSLSWVTLGWTHFQVFFIFWVNYPS